MTQERQVDRQLVILVITVLLGLLGGLLGTRFWNVDTLPWALTVLGATVIGAGVAFFLLTTDRPAGRSPTGRTAQPEKPATSALPEKPALPPSEPSRPSWPTVSTPQRAQPDWTRPAARIGETSKPEPYSPTEAARLTLPLTGESAAPSNGTATPKWWTETPSAPASSGRTRSAAPRSPAPPLSSYDPASALIAQCPRCGEFRLDVKHVAQDYAFACQNKSCGNTWNWTPGTPWPDVVVRRNLPGG